MDHIVFGVTKPPAGEAKDYVAFLAASRVNSKNDQTNSTKNVEKT
jgi:hypothetical protein